MRANLATLDAHRSSAHWTTSATSAGTSSGFSSANTSSEARTFLSIDRLVSSPLVTIIRSRACGPTRSHTHSRIRGLRTDVTAPSVTETTRDCISSSSAAA